MKNVKINSCLADFENELENLNHSEMKELVGGIDTVYVCGSSGGGSNFGGYSTFAAFSSAYGSNSSAITSGVSTPISSGAGSSAPSTKALECLKTYDVSTAANDTALRNQAILALGSIVSKNPIAIATTYGLVGANYVLNSYYSTSGLSNCLR